jgi:acyl-CoA reductase-like NAD-dependent aldehyde dehydrogenase
MTNGQPSPENNGSVGRTIPPSSQAAIDRAVAVLTASKDAWARMDLSGRIALLDQVKQELPKIEKRWIAANLAAREAGPRSLVEGTEWGNITTVYRQINFLRKALQDIVRFGKPQIPGKVTTRANGQVVAQVMPSDWKEQLVLAGVRAEVWMDPLVSLQEVGVPQASFYHGEERQGKVCALLGAGNANALVPEDFLHKLFVEGQVVALKMNPVNEYLGPVLEEGFRALITAGLLQILYGGAQEGAYLCNHPGVDTIHMTGSDRTFEAIVFGPGVEGRQRKLDHKPVLTKPFSAELGNISPVIVVPGPWTAKEIKAQSARLGSWLVLNAGCQCNTPRVIIQMKNWEHREELNRGIEYFLAGIKTDKAFYPGSFELHRQFVEAHPQALQLGEAPQEGHLPWTFIPDLDATNEADICFQREPFLGLFSETALEAGNVVEFIGRAVEFANDKLWGTLVASIMVHPASMKDPAVAAAVDQAIADLRYGTIVVNNYGALAYYGKHTPWGAYPGSDIYDVQSGIGFVNNALMFDCVQKSVVYADFAPLIDPSVVRAHGNCLLFRQDAHYQSNPTLGNLFKLLWRALTL